MIILSYVRILLTNLLTILLDSGISNKGFVTQLDKSFGFASTLFLVAECCQVGGLKIWHPYFSPFLSPLWFLSIVRLSQSYVTRETYQLAPHLSLTHNHTHSHALTHTHPHAFYWERRIDIWNKADKGEEKIVTTHVKLKVLRHAFSYLLWCVCVWKRERERKSESLLFSSHHIS